MNRFFSANLCLAQLSAGNRGGLLHFGAWRITWIFLFAEWQAGTGNISSVLEVVTYSQASG